jgi:hypothetical protein
MNKYAKKYKLSKEQIEIYEWIKNQDINTDDHTMCYWAKIYDPKRIKEVINFAKERIEKGQEIRNIGGWIQKLLKSGLAVVDDNCRANVTIVKQFMEMTKWKDLKIYEKYVKDIVTDDDLPLTMETAEFKRALESLYQKSQLYK